MKLYISIFPRYKSFFQNVKRALELSHTVIIPNETVEYESKEIHTDVFEQLQKRNPGNPNLLIIQRKYLEEKINLIKSSDGVLVFNYPDDIDLSIYTEILIAYSFNKLIFMFFPMYTQSKYIYHLNSLYIVNIYKNIDLLKEIIPSISIEPVKKFIKYSLKIRSNNV